MKKVFFSALAFVMFASVATNAQGTKAPAKTAAPAQTVAPAATENKTKITAEELPATVKTTLATDAFKDWKVATAYVVKAEKEYYEIEAVKGEEKTTLKFDKEGNKM
ncbi:hypothetical protein [Adhaeribacter terreus]|uniref:PepSY domain-containing protein n=1 Tax=Adhaeribacter terreus TaxID=529703 RepID=A0ABW0EAN1_9BACT